MRTGLIAISGWLVAAAMAVGVSWSAISVVRDSVTTTQTVSALPPPEETAGTGSAPTTTRPAPSPTVGAVVTVSGQGGMVTARCSAGRPEVLNVVPNQGFAVESDDSGAEAKFRSSDHRTEITLTCSGLTARGRVEEKSTGGGGGDDHGGGGGGNSGRGGGGG